LTIDKRAETSNVRNTVVVGGLVTYTIIVTNTGLGVANGVVVTDALPSDLSYIPGSASPVPAQTAPLVWPIGSLAPGQSVSVRFTARVVATNDAAIRNIAIVGDEQNSYIDDSDVFIVRAPTVITLQSLRIVRQSDGMNITWVTALERDTLGFALYSGARPSIDHATPLNTDLIAARGGAGGAAYVWVDPAGGDGDYYWLVEVELSGQRTVHGPFRANAAGINSAGAHRLYLPMIGGGGAGNSAR
jgi:uncharacterized repeat protein (TIGR01451 family)